MQLHDFYVLHEGSVRGAVIVQPVGRLLGDAFAILRGDFQIEPGRLFRREMGSKLMDFVCPGYATLNLVSQRVVDVLAKHEVTGWKVQAVRVQLRKGEIREDYYLLSISGKCGPIDWSKAPLIEKPPIVPEGAPYRVYKGLPFDFPSWDGSDMFVPDASGFTVVTKRVRDSLVAAHVSNVHLENCAETETREAAVNIQRK